METRMDHRLNRAWPPTKEIDAPLGTGLLLPFARRAQIIRQELERSGSHLDLLEAWLGFWQSDRPVEDAGILDFVGPIPQFGHPDAEHRPASHGEEVAAGEDYGTTGQQDYWTTGQRDNGS